MGGFSVASTIYTEISSYPLPADPLTVECSTCHSPIGQKCVRVVYNRPPRLRAKGYHYERRRDASSVQVMRDALR